MKTRTINARIIAGMFLICIFALSGFSQATGPPGGDSELTLDPSDNITGIKKGFSDKENSLELKLFPNPIKNSSTIEFNLTETAVVQIAIYNQQGIKVLDVVKQKFAAGKNKVTFTPSKLQTGTYYLCLFTGQKKGMRRCVII